MHVNYQEVNIEMVLCTLHDLEAASAVVSIVRGCARVPTCPPADRAGGAALVHIVTRYRYAGRQLASPLFVVSQRVVLPNPRELRGLLPTAVGTSRPAHQSLKYRQRMMYYWGVHRQ